MTWETVPGNDEIVGFCEARSDAAIRELWTHRSGYVSRCDAPSDRTSRSAFPATSRLRFRPRWLCRVTRENRQSVSGPPPTLGPAWREGENMKISDEECIRVRTDVWLRIGEDAPIKVQTRELCRDGVFLEYTDCLSGRSVDVIFPDGGDPALAGNSHVAGTVTWRWPDGVWIGFDHRLRSVSELLMRNSLAVPAAGTNTRSVGLGI